MINRYDAEGVAMVVATLEALQAEAGERLPLKENDGVACFDYLYTIITKDVLGCVTNHGTQPGDPQFQDPDFMSCLDVAFANRFLEAMGRGDAPPFQPRCWQSLLDHRESRDISPLMFAVAGVNAHVNFDLPFALVKACTVLGRELESGTNHDDYQRINQIFAINMQQLRQHFEDRFERGFDQALVSKVENLLGDVVVVVARNLAWAQAKRLWRIHDDQAKMLRLAKSRDRWVAAANWSLFQLDRLPAMAFRAMQQIPGPTRGVASRGLGRTGWAVPNQHRTSRASGPALVSN